MSTTDHYENLFDEFLKAFKFGNFSRKGLWEFKAMQLQILGVDGRYTIYETNYKSK